MEREREAGGSALTTPLFAWLHLLSYHRSVCPLGGKQRDLDAAIREVAWSLQLLGQPTTPATALHLTRTRDRGRTSLEKVDEEVAKLGPIDPSNLAAFIVAHGSAGRGLDTAGAAEVGCCRGRRGG